MRYGVFEIIALPHPTISGYCQPSSSFLLIFGRELRITGFPQSSGQRAVSSRQWLVPAKASELLPVEKSRNMIYN